MAMDGDVLGAAMKAAIDGVTDKTDRDALFKALGDAVVAHLQAHAVVSTTVTGTAAGGVVTGTGTGSIA